MSGLEEPYSAPAELSRSHIRNAVRILLERPPVQGRAALGRLTAEVDSEYFPTNAGAAAERFRYGPLAHPRESLVRSFALILIKGLLIDPNPGDDAQRRGAALAAVRRLHRPVVEGVLQHDLANQLRRVAPSQTNRVLRFIDLVEDVWDFIPPDVVDALTLYVETMPSADVSAYLRLALRVPELRPVAIQRLQRIPAEDFAGEMFLVDDPAVLERRVQVYLDSRSFAIANARSQDLQLHVHGLSADQIRRLIAGGRANGEIRGSFGFGPLIKSIYEQRTVDREEVIRLLRENRFEELADDLALETEEMPEGNDYAEGEGRSAGLNS
jgi:hypothetical protein